MSERPLFWLSQGLALTPPAVLIYNNPSLYDIAALAQLGRCSTNPTSTSDPIFIEVRCATPTPRLFAVRFSVVAAAGTLDADAGLCCAAALKPGPALRRAAWALTGLLGFSRDLAACATAGQRPPL
jgi:hypothetical protein